MRESETETTIDAPADRVWAVLADAGGWSASDSGVIEVEGKPAQGERLRIRSELNPKKAYPG
jgi:hypothetical protein